MSKQSAASLAIVPPAQAGPLSAPTELSESERALWAEITESKPSDWFGADSAPLLKEYVRAVVLCDVLDEKVKRAMGAETETPVGDIKLLLDMRDKEAKRATSLATKLRLTQQSRYTPQAANTANSRASGKRPWQT